MLEDYLLVQKLRRLGKALGTRCISQLGVPARCHPRRWLARRTALRLEVAEAKLAKKDPASALEAA